MERTDGFVSRAGRFALLPVMMVLAISASLLVSCAQRHTLSRDDLRSDLTSAISVASETEMSLEFALRGQAPRNFAVGHFRYVAQQLQESAKQLAASAPEPGLGPTAKSSLEQMNTLSATIEAIASELDDAAALQRAEERVRTIRAALEHEKSAL